MLRSLVGVAGAFIVTDAEGVLRRILVQPESGASERRIARNVLSALKARYGVDLDASAISINAAPADNSGDPITLARMPGRTTPAIRGMVRSAESPRVIAVRPPRTDDDVPTLVRQENAPTISPLAHARPALVRRVAAALPSRASNAVPLERIDVDAASVPVVLDQGSAMRPRLEQAELRRVAGTLRCRVVIATGNERYAGVADALNGQTTETDLAGRVTVDALRSARTPRDPIQFEGAALVDVAGRPHVVISLAVWSGHDFEAIASAEPMRGSPVEATARAVIAAISSRWLG